MLSDYFKGYIDALCYPIYRGGRKAGCVEVPMDQVDAARRRMERIGCLTVIGREGGQGSCQVWAVRNQSTREELEKLLALGDEKQSEYHRGVGRLLGYSEQHIRMFLETERPTI